MTTNTILIVLLVAAVLALLVVEARKRMLPARVERLCVERSYDKVLELLDQPLARVIYTRYEQLSMKLGAQVELGRTSDATRTIEEMLQLRMTKPQQMALFTTAFDFYLDKGDKKRAGAMLERIEGMNEKAAARVCREMFDVAFDGSTAHIVSMEGRLKDTSPIECARLCRLLALQYERRGEVRAAARYRDMERASVRAARTVR
ncbi:hypothetical protein [Collinsella sp. D33t1_170424_A12]|uniref:hypothetical protein n=1 Tax=Collinsella sp. D33t1_170424_A12 TaxID=2787135 RepID=UPI00189BB143|nr:hypothetical protein [Collinsella sp. D33t1_170424_A12]